MLLALFGIKNGGLNLFVNLVVLFLVAVYIALIAWTYFDAKRRVGDNFLVICATLGALIPFIGAAIYAIIRPPEYLEDAREREIETRAAELRVRQLEEQSCPNCSYPIERTYLRCPQCRARVKNPCESCGKPIDPRWTICPYCETPRRRPAQPPRRVAAEEAPARPAARPARPSERPVRRAPSRAAQPPRQPRPAARAPSPNRPPRPQAQPSPARQAAPTKVRKAASRSSTSGSTSSSSGSNTPPGRESGEEGTRPATAS
jgi:Double zinc ribbon